MAKRADGKLSVQVSESIGKISLKIVEAKKPVSVLVLAHGAGAGMEHTFMEQLAAELALRSVTTVRFNFPFTENKKGRPDPPAIAEKSVEAVIHEAHRLFPKLPLFAGGKSFGGRMTSHLLSKTSPEFVRGIVFFGFPLHAPGAPSADRAKHLSDVKVPMLFLQGTRDALADMTLQQGVVKKLKKAKLIKYEGADHSFKSGKKQFIDQLAEDTSQWMAEELKVKSSK